MGGVGRQQDCVFQRTSETHETQDTPVMVGGSSSLKSPWTAVWPCLSLTEKAPFCSQRGLLIHSFFHLSAVASSPRTPAPPPSCRFWCGRLLDRLGHHGSACVESRMLTVALRHGRRTVGLSCLGAAGFVCRELAACHIKRHGPCLTIRGVEDINSSSEKQRKGN